MENEFVMWAICIPVMVLAVAFWCCVLYFLLGLPKLLANIFKNWWKKPLK